MPSYRYACSNEQCDEREFSANKKMDEYQDPTPCPKCGSPCQRLQTDFCKNFVLKGGHWYRDGYSGNSHHAESIKAGKDPFKENK